jgi:hypothetical protein
MNRGNLTLTVAVLALLAGCGAPPSNNDSSTTSAAIASPAPATPSDAEYLQRLHDSWVLNHYGPEVLLREGHKVCDSIQQGMTTSQVVGMVLSDLPESSSAIQVVTAAKVGLGC